MFLTVIRDFCPVGVGRFLRPEVTSYVDQAIDVFLPVGLSDEVDRPTLAREQLGHALLDGAPERVVIPLARMMRQATDSEFLFETPKVVQVRWLELTKRMLESVVHHDPDRVHGIHMEHRVAYVPRRQRQMAFDASLPCQLDADERFNASHLSQLRQR